VLKAKSAAASSASTFSSTAAIAAPIGARATKQGTIGEATYLTWIDAVGNPGITIASPSATVTGASKSTLEVPLDNPIARFAVIDNRYGIAYGRVPSTVARIRFVLDSGDTSETTPNQLTGESYSLFDATIEVAGANLAEGATGAVVLLDRAGNEIGRLPVTGSRT
jgi:hypothetical protein